MKHFKQLGLSDNVLKALSELGFEKPTEIQELAIPELISKPQDFIGLAQTGMGKTAAFGLPILEQIDPSIQATQALILVPTRELGRQVAEQLEHFSKFLSRINILAVYGGAPIVNQIKALKKTQHIVIATPGRLIDLIGRKAIRLDEVECLVLDEADEMLSMGFKEDLDHILQFTPEDKVTWLFSATMPDAIKRIVKKYMVDPLELRMNSKDEVNVNITHYYVTVKNADKTEALMRFLDVHEDMRGIVFCRTKRETQDLAETLLKKNYKADALHGDLAQPQRDRVMKRFKSHELTVLVATDVAARGIDVNDLTHVFHYNLPDENAYYTHRSGRTARAGKSGISIAFINNRENYRIKGLERNLGISFEHILVPDSKDIVEARIQNWCVQILEKKTKGRLEPQWIEQANLMYGNLSKEELIAKLLMAEIDKFSLGSNKDLNDFGRPSKPQRRDRPGGHFHRNKRKPAGKKKKVRY